MNAVECSADCVQSIPRSRRSIQRVQRVTASVHHALEERGLQQAGEVVIRSGKVHGEHSAA